MTIRVVLADDEPLVRSGIAMLLAADGGIEVVAEVGNGQEAVAAATDLRPDLVIMDIRMPVMDGVEATRRLTELFPPAAAGRSPVAVLVLTTYNLDEAVYAALTAGASGFLLKDAVPAELVAAIRSIAAGEGWLDPGVTRALIREFAARAGAEPSGFERFRAEGAPRPGRATEAILRREGEFWLVSYDGNVMYLKDSVGLLYLSRLLARPGGETHALDLVSVKANDRRADPRTAEGTGPGLGHAGALLDERAKAEYRRRLNDLQEEIEEAERWADAARASALQAEMDQIIDELARSVGLGGRDRVAASAAERARVNATKAIKSAVARIGRGDKALGRHLDVSVRTGTFCSYAPEDPSAIHWRL